MSNAVYKEEQTSQIAFVTEMMKKHPVYRKYTEEQKKAILKLTADGNIRTESLVEDTIARCGKFKRSSESKGDDFLNGQGEVKTTTIRYMSRLTPYMKKRGLTKPEEYYLGIIPIKNKNGPLRILLYSEATKKVEYYFIPADEWPALISKSGLLSIRYRKRTNDYSRISQYKTSFKGLCQRVT